MVDGTGTKEGTIHMNDFALPVASFHSEGGDKRRVANTSSDSLKYAQGYLGVVQYVGDTNILGTLSSDTLSSFFTEDSANQHCQDTTSSIFSAPVQGDHR